MAMVREGALTLQMLFDKAETPDDVTSVQQSKVCGCMRGLEVLYMMDPVGAVSTVLVA